MFTGKFKVNEINNQNIVNQNVENNNDNSIKISIIKLYTRFK